MSVLQSQHGAEEWVIAGQIEREMQQDRIAGHDLLVQEPGSALAPETRKLGCQCPPVEWPDTSAMQPNVRGSWDGFPHSLVGLGINKSMNGPLGVGTEDIGLI